MTDIFATFEHETEDGLDTIAWVTRQPWCTGQVAMFGMSYLGMVQLAVGGLRPEGLVAIAPTVTPDDYRDVLAYRQGAFQLGQALGWHLLAAGMVIADRAARGQDVTEDAAAFGALAADTEDAYRALPLADRPALAALFPSWHTWLARENDPGYWHGISYANRRAAIDVPALHVGGWYDRARRPRRHPAVLEHPARPGRGGHRPAPGAAARRNVGGRHRLHGQAGGRPPRRPRDGRRRRDRAGPLPERDGRTPAGDSGRDIRVPDRPGRHQPGVQGRPPHPGGRGRLQLPLLRPQPRHGTPAGQVTEDEFVRATQHVFFGESFIRLPVIPSDREVDNKW